jgi:16S rRNA (guanine966-N2)-methyltransferase
MRITGGTFRSRAISSPRGDETRPTSDRVREALFSILTSRADGPALEGARVLDLYAGTGALGLEALSRGAAQVVFVERRRETLTALRANIASLGVEKETRVISRSVESVMGEAVGDLGAFDVIFADPPYADVQSGAAPRTLDRILGAGALAAGGLFVLEHASKTSSPTLKSVTCLDFRRYGDTQITFYR